MADVWTPPPGPAHAEPAPDEPYPARAQHRQPAGYAADPVPAAPGRPSPTPRPARPAPRPARPGGPGGSGGGSGGLTGRRRHRRFRRLRRAARRVGLRRSSYPGERRPWRRRAVLVLGGLLLLGVGWIAVTGLLAKRSVDRLHASLAQVQSLVGAGQVEAASSAGAAIPAEAAWAHTLTSGPAWWAAAHLPYLGRPFAVIRGDTAAADSLGDSTVPALLQLAGSLRPSSLRTGPDAVDLRPLVAARPVLAAASARLTAADAATAALPRSTWLHPLDSAHASLRDQLSGLAGLVRGADQAAQVLPAMLGGTGPKRYFVGLQNEAELRGTGGLPGAFAILTASGGRLKFERFADDTLLLPAGTGGVLRTGLDYGAAYDAAWGSADPTGVFVNSNLSAHFPYAARTWAAMWTARSHQQVDGAIALDPTVLSYFLQVTGPVTLPDRTRVTAADVVALTQRDQYTRYADQTVRKAKLIQLVQAVETRLTAGADPTGLVAAFGRAAGERRFLVWSADPDVQRVLEQTPLAGVVPSGQMPYAGLVLNNVAAGKLDYYLDRSVSYRRTGCGAVRDVLVSIQLTNGAPAAGLPPYVTGRLDKRSYPTRPGDNRLLVDWIGTTGGQLASARLDGDPAALAVRSEQGHPVFRLDLELPRGATRTLELHLVEPAGTGPVQVLQQPGVRSLALTVDDQPCS